MKHLRSVGGAHHQDLPVGGGRVTPLHLHQQLRLQPPACLVLPCTMGPGSVNLSGMLDDFMLINTIN